VTAPLYNKKEIYWYKLALNRGETSAASNIGIAYKEISQFKKSRFWLLKAIASGDGDANLELAKLYMQFGRNVQDIKDLLVSTISSRYVTEASIEEAKELLERVELNKVVKSEYLRRYCSSVARLRRR
jgi:TPR repeat protein